MASKKNGRVHNHKNKTAGVRGEERKQHFASGGSLAEWRGTSAVHKRKEEKRNDRSTAKKRAIADSQDE